MRRSWDARDAGTKDSFYRQLTDQEEANYGREDSQGVGGWSATNDGLSTKEKVLRMWLDGTVFWCSQLLLEIRIELHLHFSIWSSEFWIWGKENRPQSLD